MSNLSEEEIIKIVDKFIDGYRQCNIETGETIIPYQYGKGQKFCYVEDFEAIQGLLDLYNKEKEKNKKLEENSVDKNKLKNIMRKAQDYQLNYKDTVLFNILKQEIFGDIEWTNLENEPINKNYISKDKIKEKIEECNNIIQETNDYDVCKATSNYIDILQELLEEK